MVESLGRGGRGEVGRGEGAMSEVLVRTFSLSWVIGVRAEAGGGGGATKKG